MWLRTNTIITVLLISFGMSQSILNTNGIGMIDLNQDAASNGTSSYGLLPSYREGISISNPVTWHHLPYTYLNFGYTATTSSISDPAVTNNMSGLGTFHFIVPIKKKYSFGLSVAPYLNRQYNLEGFETTYIDSVFDDTLSVKNTVLGFGGINRLSSAFSIPVTEKERVAFAFEMLFGSSREINITTVDGMDYILNERNMYKGALVKLYLQSDRLFFKNYEIGTFAAVSAAVSPISIHQYVYQAFEDATTSRSDLGDYDSWDFPSPSLALDPTEYDYDNVVSPMDFQLGFDVKHSAVHYQVGWYHWQDNFANVFTHSMFNQQLKSTNSFNVSACLFAPENPQNALKNINYRVGLFMKNDFLNTSNYVENTIHEKGVSFGIGLQFGPTKNQLDLSYSISIKDGLQFKNELNQSLSVGLSIGDLWFVKRRQR